MVKKKENYVKRVTFNRKLKFLLELKYFSTEMYLEEEEIETIDVRAFIQFRSSAN
jgi:hypothetical protein